jgi:3,4-dihydroxy 2-butanone 4-phosphate synthase/GTP cyclohydrolase II
MGQVSGDEPVLVRVHARNWLDEVLASKRSDSNVPIRVALEKIAAAGRGVLVLIRLSEDNKSLAELIHRYQLEDNGCFIPQPADVDWRTTGTGARILSDLGVRKLIVLGAQKKYIGLSGFDLEIAGHVGAEK